MSSYTENNVNYSYTVPSSGNLGTASVASSPNASGDITLLSSFTIDNITYNVTSIGTSAFQSCSSLTSVTIPSSVTSIGLQAFAVSGLTSITIPSSVTSIGNSAFQSCSSLISVTIPSSVTSIGLQAFTFCSSLRNIKFNAFITSIPYATFYNCFALTNINIPSSVTSIGNLAFYSCSSLLNVNIPNSVTSIGDNAFQLCSSLKSVTIPSSVTSIGFQCFRQSGLTSINIPSSVTSIGSQAFAFTPRLTNINVDNNNPNYSSQDGILFNKNKTTLFKYPTWNERLTYTVPSSVTIIENRSFGVLNILDSKLENIILNQGVISILDFAFNYSKLTSINIPNSVTNFGTGVFQFSTFLTSVTFSSNSTLTSFGVQTFNNCTSLTTINIPSSVTSINNYCFIYCSSLSDITIPPSVTTIGYAAFYGCTSFTSITIPASVTNISESAFGNCTSLSKVIFLGDIPTIGSDNFTISNDTAEYFGGSSNINVLPSFFTDIVVNKIDPNVGSFFIPNQLLSSNNYIITNPSKPNNHTSSWSYQSSNTDIASISGNTITFLDKGTVTITAILSESNIYKTKILTTSFYISSSNTPSTLNFNNTSNLAQTYFSNITPINNTVTIPSNIISDIISLSNPLNATNEEKQEYRTLLVENLFNYFSTSMIINVPKEFIYLPSEIDTTSATNVQLFNTLNSTSTFPFIANTNNITETDIFYALLSNVGNSIVFNGSGDYNGYSIKIIKNSRTNYTVIKTNNTNNSSQTTETIGNVIYYAGLKIVIGSVTGQLSVEPVVPICFPSNTPVNTDQGVINISKINKNIHTIRGNKIVAITKSVPLQNHIVCIEKDALHKNIPSQDTYISLNHELLYKGKMIPAKDLVGKVEGVYKVNYNKEILYNVLLEKHDKMIVNNIIVETLSPNNIVAKLHNSNLTLKQQIEFINKLNKIIRLDNKNEYIKLYNSISK